MRLSRVLLPAALALTTAFAQADAQHRETTTVEVVQVPVYVTTAGASVRGLTRGDFELRVNGRPQNIDYFDVVDFASLSTEQMNDPRQRRLYVLLFDLVYSSPISILRARRAAEQFLDNASATDYFAIALFNRSHVLEFIVPFTRDRASLRRAVMSFRAATAADPLRLTMSPAQRLVVGNNDAAEISELRSLGSQAAVKLAIDAAAGRVENQLETLGWLAERLAPLEGYKHIVLLSDGFDNSMIGIAPAFQTGGALRVAPGEPQSFRPFRPLSPTVEPRLPGSQMRMQKKFAAAGVFLDAIDISGVRPYDMPANDSLHFYVADTGGQVVEHRNDLNLAMQRLTDSQKVVYVLGFRPPNTDRKQNAIAVRVTGAPRGSTVGYRESYSTTVDKVSSRDGLQLADIIINDIPQNGLTLTSAVTTAPKRATVNASLSGRELLALAGDEKLTGEALIYVFSGQTSIAFARKGITIDGARARAGGLDRNDIAIAQSFDLPPGNYTMKVLVRVDGRDALALTREDFTVKE
ncbi:MAG: hypothetical protein QOK37_211 [Thermoanaerobaculia bacterium]|jgi:VWFA-related protein|nr:hypothetical protein [Thermoanaerobaculia bacterium]